MADPNLALSQIEPAAPVEGACWRCQGKGYVAMRYTATVPYKPGELTLCGACIGTKIPPVKCPKCGGHEIKIYVESAHYVAMRCRGCGHEVAGTTSDLGAYVRWQQEQGLGLGLGLPRSWKELIDLVEETSRSVDNAFSVDVAVYRRLHQMVP